MGIFEVEKINGKAFINYEHFLEYVKRQDEEIERLHSIIKEAREYIQKNCILSDEWTDLGFCNFIPTGKITYKQLTSKKVKELLETLDKESNNESN